MAYDSASPSKKAVTEMTFPVSRNEHGPKFTQELYEMEISDGYPLGVSILQVQATDQDIVSKHDRSITWIICTGKDGVMVLLLSE